MPGMWEVYFQRAVQIFANCKSRRRDLHISKTRADIATWNLTNQIAFD